MENKKHLLVIRLSAMGDVAMTAIVIKAFVAQNKNAKITVLSRAFLKPIFDDIPNVDFYVADTNGRHKGVFGIYKLYRELKKLQIDAVADLHNVMRSKLLTLFFTGTKSATLNKGRAEKKALTSLKNKIFKPLKSTHERYADVFRALGYELDLSKTAFSKPKSLNDSLKSIIGNTTKKLVGIAPFAQHNSKAYPLDLMEQIIKKLSEKENNTILLFGGGAKEVDALSTIANRYKNTICIAGKIKLKEELLLISNLDCMLSMDSGNGHFSALYGVPTVTLWGGTHPYAGFTPFNQPKENSFIPDLKKYPHIPYTVYGNKMLEGYEDAMRTIEPEKVCNRINKIISA
ncbi:glycosyltransferase family 9 protein [Flavicella marina]|uniref:glycosyltransferase family 9 protein n=1 Tax=Flavicella marina TaxID=1475951 RepID=UPI0012645235|nr:glycosyltransferase family 9 protein [Flavicella marina]